MSTTTDFKRIPLSDIHPDPNQPRKIYDELAMQELIASVKEKDILQPILIRPNGNGYKLVCGERRFRASKEAGLVDIPAVIREMSDDEALELQIIENLQRKDVHPMEEAVAFKSLQPKFSLEEIAQKVGKNTSFVAQRIALTNLIKPFQDLSYGNALKLKDAIRLSRLDVSAQESILKECRVPKDWQKKKGYEVTYIDNYIDRETHDLASATFKTEDPELYPEMGACGTCRFNSAANKTLFPELNKKRICHYGVCFQIKSTRGYQKTLETAMQDPDVFFISVDSYIYGDQKKKLKAAEDMGITVLMPENFDVVEKPEPVASWEKYRKENDDWSDDEDLTPADRKVHEKDCKDDWQAEVEEYNEKLKQYDEALKSGNTKKAFVVIGGWRAKEGSIVNIAFKAKKGAKVELSGSAPMSQQLLQIETEIASIKERDARNKELDREKVYKRLVELFKLEESPFKTSVTDLSPDEWTAVLFALCDVSYQVRNYVDEALHVKDSGWDGLKRYQAIYKNQDVGLLYKALRLFILDKLVNLNECDFAKRGKPAAMFEVGKQYWPTEVKTFESEQKEKADKRSNNVQGRLNALAAKKQELQPAMPTSPKKAKAKS